MNVVKRIIIVIIFLGLIYGVLLVSFRKSYNHWEISEGTKDSINWIPFVWRGDSLGDKYYEHAAMFIPVHIAGIRRQVYFQFDLGSDYTVFYEYNTQSLLSNANKDSFDIKTVSSFPFFWKKAKEVSNVTLYLNRQQAFNKHCFVMQGYGTEIATDSIKDQNSFIVPGTIGSDFFQDKILVIDYPGQRFAFCNDLPKGYINFCASIKLDKNGGVILPMKYKGEDLNIFFDNGASLFPLLSTEQNISEFDTGPDIDTVPISSWGVTHNVTGRMLQDSFTLCGIKFPPREIYVNHSGLGIDKHTDATTGNALFEHNIIVIDFKHKRFGLK